jgi:WhiB family redox-sensing transcriptional regulator
MRPEWMQKAACRDVDPEWFFPKSTLSEGAVNALRTCRSCPVAQQCFIEAMESDEDLGIWGGKTPRQRKKIRKTWEREKASS